MDRVGSAIIDFAETAYNLRLPKSEWLPRLLEDGNRIIGDGLGVAGIVCQRSSERGAFAIEQVHVESCPDDFTQCVMKAQLQVSQEFLWEVSRPTHPKTLSEAAEGLPKEFEEMMHHFDRAEDGLGMSAFDPDGHGVYLIAPLTKRTSLGARERERLQMVAAHFGAGSRLRRALDRTSSRPDTALPHGAEAVLDPKNFRLTDATGDAKARDSIRTLREGAKRVDQARGGLRKLDPETALELWTALIRGRWSIVDWFDSDGRRFVLALPNAPTVVDPRGLTKQEALVVSLVAAGHTNKLIAYQLGLSKARVSALANSAMRKVRVRSRAQLAKKWCDFVRFASGGAP